MAYDKRKIQDLNDEFRSVVDALAAKYNLTVKHGVMRWDSREARVAVTFFDPVTASGDVKSHAQTEWEKDCLYFGFLKEDFGRTIVHHDGQKATICGLKPRSKKYPILMEMGGKTYKFARSTVRSALDEQYPSEARNRLYNGIRSFV